MAAETNVAGTRIQKILGQLSTSPKISNNKHLSSDVIKLNDGNVIPTIAIGTYKHRGMERYKLSAEDRKAMSDDEKANEKLEIIEDEKEFANALYYALKHGYRHIDTAQLYCTEYIVGNVLNTVLNDKNNTLKLNISLKREDIWITTKIAQNIRAHKDVVESIEKSLSYLQLKYVDLCLIHSPHSSCDQGKRGEDIINIYRILHEYKKKGIIRSVGVSNFGIKHLKTLKKLCPNLPHPSVNQIEVHCFLYEKELIQYCLNNNILIQAYCPLARWHKTVKTNQLLLDLAKKYNKTMAQIMIKYLHQNGYIVITKTVKLNRLIENGNIFDFQIDDEDMVKLGELSKYNIRASWNPLNVRWDI